MIPNFSFVIGDSLAGCADPAFGGNLSAVLREMASEHGIDTIVTLTESPLPESVLRDCRLRWLHLPVADFSIPSIEAADRGVEFVRSEVAAGRRVVVHCSAGCGRTGTFLACCLVALQGHPAAEAVDLVRRLRGGSIETLAQEAFVARWAAAYEKSSRGSQEPQADCR